MLNEKSVKSTVPRGYHVGTLPDCQVATVLVLLLYLLACEFLIQSIIIDSSNSNNLFPKKAYSK